MLERKFILEENQKIWDIYYAKNLQAWDLENKKKLESLQWTEEEKIEHKKKLLGYNIPLEQMTPYKYGYIVKKQNIQQYKPILLRFEEYCNKSFNDISANDIEDFIKYAMKTNRKNHLISFMVHCVNNGIIKNNNNDFLIALLPKRYKIIGKLLSNSN